MTYYIDSNSFRVLESYYPSRFPSFWTAFDAAAAKGEIASVSEVHKEVERGAAAEFILEWIASNRDFFRQPNEDELAALAQIFAVPHFQGLVGQRAILKGTPVADPFLIAAAMVNHGTVVTEERAKPNSAKIPNVCEHFEVSCLNLEDMLTALDWRF